MEPKPDSIVLKLPLFSMPPPTMRSSSPEHSGMLTPPLYTSASVPFRWEEEPGKPRPCTALIALPFTVTATAIAESHKCLELPPRLFLEPMKITQTPSTTTVLEGPYGLGLNRPKFTSSSFRFSRERQESFDRTSSKSPPERGQLSSSSSVLLGKKLDSSSRGRGLFGSWRYRTPKVSRSLDCADFASGESCILRTKVSRITRNGSFSSLSHARSHLWAAVYEGIKQVIPWKSRKSKKRAPVVQGDHAWISR